MQKDLLNNSGDGFQKITDFQTRNFQKKSEFDEIRSIFCLNSANLQSNVSPRILIGFQ